MADPVDAEISDVIRNGLHQVLTKELDSEKIDVSIEEGSKKGDNFIGIVYRVNGKLTADDSKGEVNNDKSINVILKVAPTHKARRDTFGSRECFLREIQMYDEVLPMFLQFQESKGIIPEENGFHEYPKCYKTIDAHMDETLVLQDLRTAQFEMFDRFQVITIDHVRLLMKALGKYHAISFALRDQQPEKLKRFSNFEENFMRNVDENLITHLKSVVGSVLGSLDHEGDEPLLAKVEEFFKPGHIAIMRECCNGELAEPYSVICHGDCWNNNLLFKCDENQKPVDLRLLDWQIARYATPVTDLVYYIFCCTTKPLRDQYYDDIIKTYHASLSEMLTRLGSDPAKLFPFDALQDQLRQHGKFGLVMSTLLLPMITLESEKCPDLNELADSFEKGEPIDNAPFTPVAAVFNKRMRDVIIDMDRLGYF